MATKLSKKLEKLPIVSIDPVSLQSYMFRDNSISYHKLTQSSPKKEFYISYMYTKDIIFGSIEISRRLEEADVANAIEIEAYEHLGLDSAVEYKIIHLETDSGDKKNKLYNVFAFDSSLIAQTFNNVSSKTKYIDYITAAPFLMSSLYEKNMLESKGVDCFIYFQKTDSFLSIYKNGKYLFSKSLNFSLEQINEKFCEISGERINEKKFFESLTASGLEASDPVYRQHLMQLFNNMFTYINDVLIFFKQGYNIETIDRAFVGTEIGLINGINEYSQNYLGIQTSDFDFNIAKNKNEWQIDQIQILSMLTAQIYQEKKDDALNLTMFKRPPSFAKRASGKLITAVALGLLVSIAWPAIQFIQGMVLNIDTSTKESKYKTAHKKANDIRTQLAALSKEIKFIDIKLKLERSVLKDRTDTLKEIYNKKVNYPMKGVILDDLIKLINNRNIFVSNISSLNDSTTITLKSKNDKQLTELLKDISTTGRYVADTKKIVKLPKSHLYESKVTVINFTKQKSDSAFNSTYYFSSSGGNNAK